MLIHLLMGIDFKAGSGIKVLLVFCACCSVLRALVITCIMVLRGIALRKNVLVNDSCEFDE